MRRGVQDLFNLEPFTDHSNGVPIPSILLDTGRRNVTGSLNERFW